MLLDFIDARRDPLNAIVTCGKTTGKEREAIIEALLRLRINAVLTHSHPNASMQSRSARVGGGSVDRSIAAINSPIIDLSPTGLIAANLSDIILSVQLGADMSTALHAYPTSDGPEKLLQAQKKEGGGPIYSVHRVCRYGLTGTHSDPARLTAPHSFAASACERSGPAWSLVIAPTLRR